MHTDSRKQSVLEKVAVVKLVKEYPIFFVEPRCSVQCSEEQPVGPCREPDKSNLHPHTFIS
jgi:hypothetical protein